MLRVGYPAIYSADLLKDFPQEVELHPRCPTQPDHDIEIDVWDSEPLLRKGCKDLATPARRPAGALDDGRQQSGFPRRRPPCHHLQCRRARIISPPRSGPVSAILAMLNISVLSPKCSVAGIWKARFDASVALRGHHRRTRAALSARHA